MFHLLSYNDHLTLKKAPQKLGSFFLFLFMGSALDGPEWKIPLVGAIIGVAIMKIGVFIARMEGSEYV